VDWVAAVSAELDSNPEVTHLQESTVWGYRENNLLMITERTPAEDACVSTGVESAGMSCRCCNWRN
jgi:hypothetical protein